MMNVNNGRFVSVMCIMVTVLKQLLMLPVLQYRYMSAAVRLFG